MIKLKKKKTDISFKVTNVHNKNIYGNHPSMLNRSRQVHTAEMNKKSVTSFKVCNEYIQCKHIGTDVDKTCFKTISKSLALKKNERKQCNYIGKKNIQ